MRHQKKVKKLNLKKDERKRLMKNLATSLILYEKIKTTETKGKAIKPYVEHLITVAKQNNEVNAYRYLNKFLFDKNAVKKIIKELKPKYEKINGGYIKIYKIKPRRGDSAPMVYIQLI